MLESLDPASVHQAVQQPDRMLIDIRGPLDWAQGVPTGAQCMSPEQVLQQADELRAQHPQIFIICHRGNQSKRLVSQLSSRQFIDVAGGYQAWLAQALPTELPVSDAVLTQDVARYDRQLRLSGFGLAEQQRLQQAHVLVVGAGGLGCPALLYLVGCGVGRLTLLDDDQVALHNLHRQILFTEADAGQAKVAVAQKRLQQLNSTTQITPVVERLHHDNADQWIAPVDLVLDGSDNIATRHAINDSCLRLQKPWIYAAVTGFEIQVSLFSADPQRPCYRCLFPDIEADAVANCDAMGVLGPVPGLAAMIQVTEAIKHLTHMQPSLAQRMLIYDVLHHQFKVLKYPANQSAGCVHG
ncbi:ThiF family adenylyltransferase [Marinicella meishanensis]|uniref:ThiF family adenylyltransferase n=1 Tax=Marinicella meishanensis TaxID=2873263 RepID=UPI001CBCB674|nr:ThiF family adenylyltransferase [Marinicella sp. NBU2979]